ncbi:MAG: GNAT family protein [Bacteroidota bacterium]
MSDTSTDLFSPTLVLESDLVRLRPIYPGDISAYRDLVFEPSIWTYFTSEITTEADLQFWVMDAITQRSVRQRAAFAIIKKESGEIAGSSSFGNYSAPDRRVEIGWSWIHPRFQRTGINRQAKFLLLEFAFRYAQLLRVEFKTDVLNAAARKGLLGIGSTEEGVLRSHTNMPGNRRRDTIYYSILEKEWEEIRQRIFSGISFDLRHEPPA